MLASESPSANRSRISSERTGSYSIDPGRIALLPARRRALSRLYTIYTKNFVKFRNQASNAEFPLTTRARSSALPTASATTTSADAQGWFDRGLNWCFGYHHEEAVACFEKTLETDPNCAMAHWGAAYAVGPNYNSPWELQDPAGKAAALARAYASACAALALVGPVTAPERALIEALPARYPQRDPIDDQRPWNDAFADAMRLAHQAHSDDLDLRFLFGLPAPAGPFV